MNRSTQLMKCHREVCRLASVELDKIEGIPLWERPSLYRHIQRKVAEKVFINAPEGMLDDMYPLLAEE